jgi:hypothetical protein
MRASKVHTGGTREHGRTGTNQLRRSQLKGFGTQQRHEGAKGRGTLLGEQRLEEKQLKEQGLQHLERQRMMDPATWCVNHEGEESGEVEVAAAGGDAEEGAEGGASVASGGCGGAGGAASGAVDGAALTELLSRAKSYGSLELGKKVLVAVAPEFSGESLEG